MIRADAAPYNGHAPEDDPRERADALREAALDGAGDLRAAYAAPVYALLAVEARLAELTALLAER